MGEGVDNVYLDGTAVEELRIIYTIMFFVLKGA